MKLSTKRRIKVSLAFVVLGAGFYLFSLIGAGVYALGLSALCLAVFYASFWPEVWTTGAEIKGKHQKYTFFAGLAVSIALLVAGMLLQSQFEGL